MIPAAPPASDASQSPLLALGPGSVLRKRQRGWWQWGFFLFSLDILVSRMVYTEDRGIQNRVHGHHSMGCPLPDERSHLQFRSLKSLLRFSVIW